MRDINDFKFRGYDTEYEKMTYFDDEDYLLSYGQILRSKIEWNYDYDEEIIGYEDVNNKIILMQYTGLKDKNGKEIYEGDIIRIKNSLIEIEGEVIFDTIDLSFEVYDKENDCKEMLWYTNEEFEVIGNIYDNPEILKGE